VVAKGPAGNKTIKKMRKHRDGRMIAASLWFGFRFDALSTPLHPYPRSAFDA
jgi:hypothetical protein